jgi:RNA polymerase sigma-70 factor (ECF subfamily)
MIGKKKYRTESDESLMQRLGKHDAAAFEELYERYGKLLYNYFLRMLWKDREKARDFTQDLFARIVQKHELYDPSRSFKTWIYSIANNMCKNEYARQQVRRDAQPTISDHLKTTEKPIEGNDMDRAQFQKDLQSALQTLDEIKRTTFELRFVQEMSITEISQVMQCSEGTVKSRLFYTLKDLNGQLRAYAHLIGALTLLLQTNILS